MTRSAPGRMCVVRLSDADDRGQCRASAPGWPCAYVQLPASVTKPARPLPVHLGRHRRRQIVGDEQPGLRAARAGRCRAARHAGSWMSGPTTSRMSPWRSRRYGSCASSSRAMNLVGRLLRAPTRRCGARSTNQLLGAVRRASGRRASAAALRRATPDPVPATRASRALMSSICARACACASCEPQRLRQTSAADGDEIEHLSPPRPHDEARGRLATPGETPSPFRLSTSVPRRSRARRARISASTAASSSAPSALMVISAPRAAARSSSPMMLLPSMRRVRRDRPSCATRTLARQPHERRGRAGVHARACW